MWAARVLLCLVLVAGPRSVAMEPLPIVRSEDKRQDLAPVEDAKVLGESMLDTTEESHSNASSLLDHRAAPSGHWDAGGILQATDRPCNKSGIRRNRHKMCFSSECGPPPTAFMMALAHGQTQLESFASASEVLWESWWAEHVTRTEMEGLMTPNRNYCGCEGCQEWNIWAMEELARPAHCKFPGHDWRLLFSEMNSDNTYDRTEATHEGQTWVADNEQMREIGITATIAYEGFSGGATYRHVAAKQPQNVWHRSHLVNQTWKVHSGRPMAVWQFVLTCKVFNKHNMYINEAHFATNIKVTTASTAKPKCNPNVDSCGMVGKKAGHHC